MQTSTARKLSLRELKAAEKAKKTAEMNKSAEETTQEIVPEAIIEVDQRVTDPVADPDSTSPHNPVVDTSISPVAPEVTAVVALQADQSRAGEKRPAPETAEEGRKKRRKHSKKPRRENPIYEDGAASANLIASLTSSILPAPDNLSEAERFRETSAEFLKVHPSRFAPKHWRQYFANVDLLQALSSMNRMVCSYDSSAYHTATELEEIKERLAAAERAREEAEAMVAEANAAKERADGRLEAVRASERDIADKFLRLNERTAKLKADVAHYKRLYNEEKHLREKEVAREVKAARRLFAEEVDAHKAKLSEFDNVCTRFQYLMQADANADLIKLLEEGRTTLEEEKKQVEEWQVEYADAKEPFLRLSKELLEDLKIPPVSPVSADVGLGNRSAEGLAALVGVSDPSGSNLREEEVRASEEEVERNLEDQPPKLPEVGVSEEGELAKTPEAVTH